MGETWSPSSIVKQPPVLGEKQPEFDQSCGGTRKTPPTLACGVMNGSGNVSLKNQWTLVLGLFVLFVLFCSHTLPQPRKALKQFSIGLFPAEKSFEGRKKKQEVRTKTMMNTSRAERGKEWSTVTRPTGYSGANRRWFHQVNCDEDLGQVRLSGLGKRGNYVAKSATTEHKWNTVG